MSVAIRPVGDAAFLLEVEPAQRHAVARAITDARLEGVVEVVPAERSVLVSFDQQQVDGGVLAEWVGSAIEDHALRALELAPVFAAAAVVEVRVQYDGPDLDAVADLTGRSTSDVIARHLAGDYVVAFMGFAPGFAYLDGLDPALQVPRLETPRTRVDAGALAIAGARSCIYPRASPGGWRVLGHTHDVLFDAAMDPPALLRAGVRVRFREA